MENISRREVLLTAGAATALVCLNGCAPSKEKEKVPVVTSGTITIGPAADYPAGTANGKFMDLYGIFIANESGTPVAIRPKCTHKGCTVNWDEPNHDFECPCHGSKFSLLGLPTKGPATRPLAMVRCERTADGKLSVDLSKLYALPT